MSKLITLFVLIVFLFPNWALAQELENAVEPVEAVEVVLTPAQKNLDLLVEQYKAKKLELSGIEKDLLRLEGAIMIIDSMVKEEKQQEEK